MQIEYGDRRKLSHGAIKYLNNYNIVENKRTLYVNFILQIYKCVSLLHIDYYSCSLFDDECICNTFILKYSIIEGRPYEGDIISITKINLNILSDGEHKLFCCEETKLLEKSAKFLINPTNLINITSKSKKIIIDKKEDEKINKENNNINNNNINIIKKCNEKEIKNKNNINQKELIFNNDDDYNFNENNEKNKEEEKNDNNINNKENFNKNENKNNKENYSKNEIINKKENYLNNSDEINFIRKIRSQNIIKTKSNLIKIEPKKKKEEPDDTKQKEIFDSINLFLDDFQDGENINLEDSNSIQAIFEEFENDEKNKNDNIMLKNKNIIEKNINFNINRNIKLKINNLNCKHNNNKFINNGCIAYIEDIKNILKNYRNKPVNFKCKIKCSIKTFYHSYDNFYRGCSICHKKIRDNNSCCSNGKEILIYNFYITVRDASGVVTIFFFDKQARQLMGVSPEKYKELLDDKQPIGQIMLSEYINDFYINKYLFTIEFLEPRKNEIKKKYNVVKVEKINKNHYHQLSKEIKDILHINQ